MAMEHPMDFNPLSKLWKNNSSNVLLCAQLSKFMKVGKLVVGQIMIFVENENTFSTLTFMKIRLWNCLCEHLDLVVHMFAQPFHIVNTFLYDDAITTWIMKK
jgi:hypothetical protein